MTELTPREETVLRTLAQADPSTIAEVARRLGKSPNTVRSQLQVALQKLDVHERVSAFRAMGWLVIP